MMTIAGTRFSFWRRLDDDPLRQTGDLVGLLAHVLAFDDVVELHLAGDLGEDRRGERIPFHQLLARLHVLALANQQVGTVGEGVALALAALGVGEHQLAAAVDHHQVAALRLDRGDVQELHPAGVLGHVLGLLGDPAGGAAVVEGAHGELGAGLADRLRER
jgi:hypothetical protein